MPPGKKYGGRDWLPGQSGNPKGGPKRPKELVEAKRLNKEAFEGAVNRVRAMTMEEMAAMAKDPKCNVLDRAIIGQFLSAVKGKTSPMSFMMDRMVGPVKQQFAVSIETDVGRELANMTEEQKRARLELIRNRNKP